MTRGWGYKIDYDREIEIDTKEIAHLSDVRVVRLCEIVSEILAMPEYAGDSPMSWTIPQLAFVRADVAGVLGYSSDDLRALHEATRDPWEGDIFGEPKLGDRARGDALLSTLGEFPLYRADVRADLLRKARASLSRHKRNKIKRGGA